MFIQKKITLFILFALAFCQTKAQFTNGNLVVTRVGDGTTLLNNGNTAAVSLLEFNTSATATTLALAAQTPISTVNLMGGGGNNWPVLLAHLMPWASLLFMVLLVLPMLGAAVV